jgi:hypothetical protein
MRSLVIATVAALSLASVLPTTALGQSSTSPPPVQTVTHVNVSVAGAGISEGASSRRRAALYAAHHCKTGKPCGHSCIKASDVCHK